jgi:2-keto-3-deoxy-L-rhamnonate aldolase RhmA
MLDMGWDGVLTPQTNSRDEARRAVAACRYPSEGRRGFGPRRAGNYYRDQDEYVKLANDSIICAIQIESVSAVEEIDEIVKVPGIDWIFVGPCDMSGTTERFLDLDNPKLWKAIRKIFAKAQARGIPTSNAVGGVENIKKQLDLGCQLVVLGEDMVFLKEGLDQALKTFHKVPK